jgi:hypothetical protein
MIFLHLIFMPLLLRNSLMAMTDIFLKCPISTLPVKNFSAGGSFVIQQGRLLSNLFNSRYHSNRYRVKNGESSFFPDTIITLTNGFSRNRYALGFELFFKINPHKGVDVQFEWQQDISNRHSILLPADTIKGRDAPGDFSLKLSGRINEKLVKYLRYGELFFVQNHGTILPYSGTIFRSWDFESGLYALSKPLFLNLAFELGASFFYFDQGSRLDNEVTVQILFLNYQREYVGDFYDDTGKNDRPYSSMCAGRFNRGSWYRW